MAEAKRIYLSPPHMGGNEQKFIREAFDTNWIAPLGANVDNFELSLAGYCKSSHVVALSSGTAAIHLALILLGVKSGDEVITSSFTFSATVNPVVYQGAKPVFIDSEPETWNMDPDLLEQALRDRQKNNTINRVKAVIVVHLYGMPSKIDRIMEVADKYGIPVIEDAAEALGSKFGGKQVGTFGQMGILSFNGNKIITTSGGGALISDIKENIDKARFLATQARDNAPHYQHSQIGYNYRMSNILAGIGRGQMEVLENRILKRRENFLFYKTHLGDINGIDFLEEPGHLYYSNRWLTTLLIDPAKTGTDREIIQTELGKENIESRPLWKPMHLQPVFQSYDKYNNGISERLFMNGICLPSGSGITDEERDKVLRTIMKCLVKA